MTIGEVKAKAMRKSGEAVAVPFLAIRVWPPLTSATADFPGMTSTPMYQFALEIANPMEYQQRGFSGTTHLLDASPIETCDFIYFCLS